MKSTVFAVIAFAATAFVSAVPAGAGSVLSDKEMDNVTAGDGGGVITASGAVGDLYPVGIMGNSNPGAGTITAAPLGQNPTTTGTGIQTTEASFPVQPGLGNQTAISVGH